MTPEGYRMIAIDQRGFGDSTYRTEVKSVDDFAKDVIDFCSVLKLSKVIIVGWSFGGLVTKRVG